MNHRPSLARLPYIAVLCGVAVFFLRSTLASGGSGVPMIAFSVLMTVVFLLAAASLEKNSEASVFFHRLPLASITAVIGAAALAAGCLQGFGSAGTFAKILSLLGVIAAVGLIAAQVLLLAGKQIPVYFFVFAVLFYVIKLFRDFRHWMVDPIILDYCFMLFALISFMVATYQAGAFCFDKGNRRQLAFFSLTGVMFGASAIVGGDTASILIYGGSILWMLSCSLQILH
ncbi:MAG: hypothetical protein MJ118_00440 [Clostridia bacterium]|nr:hypothetical protein [Clostridia bacterium]